MPSVELYINQEDANDLVKLVKDIGGIFIFEDGTKLTEEQLCRMMDQEYIKSTHKNSWGFYYIVFPDSHLVFMRVSPKAKPSLPGLVIAAPIPDLEMTVCLSGSKYEFNEYIQFMVSIPNGRENNHYESGIICYNNYYYDVNNERVPTSERLTKLFNRIRSYIRKSYIRSDDKARYMGPHCYELYKKGEYIPCAPYVEVPFPKDK